MAAFERRIPGRRVLAVVIASW